MSSVGHELLKENNEEKSIIETDSKAEEVEEEDNEVEDEEDYEEALIYVELPDITGKAYLNNAKKIVIKDLVGGDTGPTLEVDGTEFIGTHKINLGSNHFFSCGSNTASVSPEYVGHSIKTTDFHLSRINIPSKKL